MSPRLLPRASGRDVVRAFERAGFSIDRIRGSHHIMVKEGSPNRYVSVPVHGNRDLPIGTLAGIVEQAGLTPEEFKRLLNRR